MNVLIIPSWYPSKDFPITGMFIKEQAQALAKYYPGDNFGISLWGSHEKSLWLDKQAWKEPLIKLGSLGMKPTRKELDHNLVEYFTPALTWTRKFLSGNISGLQAACLKNARRFQQEFGPIDLIHAHVSHPAGAIASAISEKLEVPYVITEHMGPFPFQSLRDKEGRPIKLITQALQSAHGVIAVSDFMKWELADYCDAMVIYNMVHRDYFLPRITPPEQKVVFVGRLEKEKGIELLLNVWEVLRLSHPEWSLEILGAGTYFRSKEKEGIIWSGLQSRDQVIAALSEASFLVLPSEYESFGLVLAEAMALGRPVVSTKCGGPEDIVPGISGELIDVGSEESLLIAMREMISRRNEFQGQDIRSFAQTNFHPEVVTHQIVDFYHKVLAMYKNDK